MGFEEIQGWNDKKQQCQGDQNDGGRPADGILKLIVDMFPHDLRIIDHQLHRDQTTGKSIALMSWVHKVMAIKGALGIRMITQAMTMIAANSA